MEDRSTAAKVIYILYLVSLVIGLTAVIGVIMAYVNRDNASDWVQAHYRYQIRTFWIGMLYLVIASITMPVGIGYLLLLGWFIWLIVRCARGLSALDRRQPPANVESWLFA